VKQQVSKNSTKKLDAIAALPQRQVRKGNAGDDTRELEARACEFKTV